MKDQNSKNKDQSADKNRSAQPADKANTKNKSGSTAGRK